MTIKPTTKRAILRGTHIVFALPILGYVYGPPAEVAPYAPYFRFIYLPVVMLTGLLMWKGHVLLRLFGPSRGSGKNRRGQSVH